MIDPDMRIHYLLRRWPLVATMVLISACSSSNRAIGEADASVKSLVAEYALLADSNALALTLPDEPGEPLVILGALTDSATKRPIPNWPITIYHSDASGSYGGTNPDDESSSRLKGVVVTDSLGRFRVTTVLPGEANQHIHLGVTGARPEAYDLFFSQLIGVLLRQWAEGSSQAFVVELHRLDASQLVLVANVIARGLSPDARRPADLTVANPPQS